MWMIRNPLYRYNKLTGVKYTGGEVKIKGNPNISDKYKIPGWMWLPTRERVRLLSSTLYSSTRNLRIRLGYKIKSDKFPKMGFAPLVFTINPFYGYEETK